LLAVGGLLAVADFSGCLTWCVRQRRRRGGRLVEVHFGCAAWHAPGFQFWGAVLALIGLILCVLACVPGVRTS